MNTNRLFKLRALSLCLSLSCALCAAPRTLAQSNDKPSAQSSTQSAVAAAAATPTEVVRAFYTALREARFRDALMISVYRPAIEPLSAAELEELRPDFERIAGAVPPDFEFTGESISGD